jgi:hypothetical protein
MLKSMVTQAMGECRILGVRIEDRQLPIDEKR